MKSLLNWLRCRAGYTRAFFLSFSLLSLMPFPLAWCAHDEEQPVEDDTSHSEKESFPKEETEANPPHTYKGVGLKGEAKHDRVTAPRRAAPS